MVAINTFCVLEVATPQSTLCVSLISGPSIPVPVLEDVTAICDTKRQSADTILGMMPTIDGSLVSLIGIPGTWTSAVMW